MLFGKFSIFLALFILFAAFQEPALAIKKSYIVYLGGHSHGPEVTAADLRRVTDSHTQLLASFLGSEEKAKDAIIYNYKRHVNGFAAVLEEEEAAEIAKHPDVVSVFPNQGKKLHTTHSWDFLMLERQGVIHPSSAWKKARYGEDTIIANLDTGVWPESKSFSGHGYGPIPSKWKGICQFDNKAGPLCNRKLIGARYFNKGFEAYAGKLNSSYCTPRDTDGHGSHTLSTAAGNFVPGASVFGVGNGTAKGGSPKARVASYKVCWPPINGSECFDADIMKAFDTAIDDGVDVLSVSLARIRDNTVSPMRDADYQGATPFAYGSGHIRPNRAVDPGLVYDLTLNDYLDFLCGIGYSQTQIRQVAGIHYHKCPEDYSILNFNNPSITVLNVRGTVNVTRTVKLVGKPGIYAARLRAPYGYSISVEPNILQFKKTGEEKSFKLIITVHRASSTVYGFGELIWQDSTHYVRSPIVLSAADP
ncbi:Subtilisin-like protease SBT5.4 [Sesamum alatum]|uniref:Subtilisin-like protease SBT5.4 n=1 Tax=Sesamum alatum TaxID=300844 RepID=A0AAE1Z019_9LAMI|nr:Subtilisin-like protease SBT5.4 [Sesamum alatum]